MTQSMPSNYGHAGKHVAVLGAGVVGLSTAIRLVEAGYRVTVLAKEVATDSQSRLATAVWHVYLVKETAEVLRWASETLACLYEIADSEPDAGLEVIRGVELFRNSEPTTPSWSAIPKEFRLLSGLDVLAINRKLPSHESPVRWGYAIEVPAARMDVYLGWLLERFRRSGGDLIRQSVEDIESVGARFPMIVNCCGAGAKTLANDQDFVPVKGQYFVVDQYERAPQHYWGDDDHPSGMAYVICRQGQILIGGTAEFQVDDSVFDLNFDELIGRLTPLEPMLCDLRDKPRREVVCVRPWRKSGVRLARDTSNSGFEVVHNYGHGGSGFSLSWGCAARVVELVNASCY